MNVVIEHGEFQEIPGYSIYRISMDGKVLNTETGKLLSGSVNPAGYFNFRIISNDGYCMTWGRHRLLAYVFKNPGCDITNLVVNHINGIKGDDRLDNLEWVTHQGNMEHAGARGLTTKCIPVSVRDIVTGEIDRYPSAIAAANATGMSKDAILHRLKCGEKRVFPEGKQYRGSLNDGPWHIPDENDLLMQFGPSKKVLMKNVITGNEQIFNSLKDCSRLLDVPYPTVAQWINSPDHPVLPGYVQLKWLTDRTPWRSVNDPHLDLERFTKRRCIAIFKEVGSDARIFDSMAAAAVAQGLKTTTLFYRLMSRGCTVFSDGYRYAYYSDLVSETVPLSRNG